MQEDGGQDGDSLKDPDSTYAKPFMTVPEQIRRLRERGMECGGNASAAAILERYGYYRLSGYWFPYRQFPPPPAPRVDDSGREVRLDDFTAGANLAHVVALYDFDHALRTRLGEVLSTLEICLRFYIGHRLGKVDKFSHRKPALLDQLHAPEEGEQPKAHASYKEWLEEYDRNERRATDAFVLHFRKKYGPHLPIWVATEVMSFGVLSRLYTLMPQPDQEILAARFQVTTADGKGDRGAFANWLNTMRLIRNISAHYGRVWNRVFLIIDPPGRIQSDPTHHLSRLSDEESAHKLYGALLIMRHLMLSVAPERTDVLELVNFITEQSATVGFRLGHLGFPGDWKGDEIWKPEFTLERDPMLAASLLDRTDTFTAVETRAALTGAEVSDPDKPRTEVELARAQKAAQRKLLRSYVTYEVVIEVNLGKTRYYPAFQFRDGKIIEALAEINRALSTSCADAEPNHKAAALLDWWQTPHPDLPLDADGAPQSPCDLLEVLPESEFADVIDEVGAMSAFEAPQPSSEPELADR